MARFTTFSSAGEDLLPPDAYILQVLECNEQVSSKGSDMFKLKLTTIPHDKFVWDFLVFHPNSEWVVRDFCHSAGLELPAKECELGLDPSDCVLRICYAHLIHEQGRDGKIRLSVDRYISRQEAIETNPELAQIPLPKNIPAPKKLSALPGTTESPLSAARKRASAQRVAPQDAEPDDIPFRTTIYREVWRCRLNRIVF
jgi:hypothetical protein